MKVKSGSLKKVTFKILRILSWIVASIFGLLIIIALLIQVPAIQQKITNTAVSFVGDKIGTKVALDHISLSIPKKVVLEGIYLEDQKNDTLLYVGKLSVDTDLFALISNKIELNNISVEDFKASVTRTSDSVYNFDYIINAFSDSTAAPKDTTQKGWTFSIVDVNLNKFNVSYNDAVAGDDVRLKLNDLALSMDDFDLDALRFKVDEFLLDGVEAMITQSKLPTQTSTSSEEEESSANVDFMISAVDLKDININYSQLATKQEMMLNLGKSTLRVDEIDLAQNEIAVSKFLLDKTFVAYHILPGADTTSSKQEAKEPTSDNNPSWTFSLNEIALKNNSLQYYDFNKPRTSVGIDFNHLWVSGFNFTASDIAFSDEGYQAIVNQFTLHERSGFDVKAFNASLKVNETEAQLSNFLFQTNSTQIHLDASGKFSSLQDLPTQYSEMQFDCKIDETYFGLADLDFFVPSWSDKMPIKKNHLTDIHVDANVHGKVKDLIVENFGISLLEKTSIATNGKVKGLPDIDQTSFNIHLDKFYTTAKDVQSVLADTLVPTSIGLPSWLELSGDFSGTVKTPSVKSQLKSEFGSFLVDASLDTRVPPEKYKGTFAIDDFNLGKLLKQTETIGLIDLDASIDGSGFNLDDMQGRAKIVLNSFDFKEYTYKDFVVEGDFKNYLFSGKAALDDPNLKFNFDGDLDYNLANEKREYHFDFKLENADFNALHLTERPLKARFDLTIDLDNADPRDLNGNLSLHHVAIYNGEELYKVDSLLFASIHDDEKTELSISSDLVDGKFSGSFDLLDLPNVMRDYFNTYYEFQDSLNYPADKLQQFSFDLQINSTRLLTDVLVPDLKRFVPGEIKGEFNNLEKKLDVSINIDEIEYGSIMGEGLKFDITSDPNNLNYEFHTGEIAVSVVSIPALDLSGEVTDNTLTTHLVLYDSLEKERYVLGGIFTSIKDAFKFHLLPDEVILDYNDWTIPEENSLTIAKSGVTSSDFRLENGTEKIIVDVNSGQKSASIKLEQLNLSTLTRIAFANDTLVSGVIQGKIEFVKADSSSLMNADIAIKKVSLSNSTLGDVHIVAKQPNGNEYDFGLDITGPATQIDIKGNFKSRDTTQQANVNAKISTLDLAAIEPLLFDQAKELKGNLTGQITMSGNTNKPEINGKLTFQNTSVIPTYINTSVKLDNESITFSQKEITFQNFEIKDEKGNPLSINGKVEFGADSNHKLDLTTKADKFLLLNTTEDSGNDMFFGKLIIDADIKVKGTTNQPELDVQLSLGDESDFTYVVPESEKGVMEREGVVKFVDRDVNKDPFLAAVAKEVESREDSVSTIQGITLTAKIEVNDKETLNILIDPVTGDKLTVKGNATLTLDIDATGNMNLTGRYELTSGAYGLTFYKLVKRDFEIQKGSTIIWSGDPLNADLDITGLYKVETSPDELLQTQSQSGNSDQYKQRLPFIVNLNVDGKILSPLISFSIDMPEQRREALGGSVYARLQDINTRESDLNKQVFSLLILKRFVADNPFESQGGATLQSAARTSVSRFLTDQLNQMSDNIKGVQLTFDLKSYEDYSGDEATNKTELQLGVSKTLFSDRLVVKLSGNVDLEGQDSPQNFSDYIGDLALEYKLTEDGRLRVTGFYNSDYDMIDGELKDTGVGLIYIKDYDSLRELFKANDKEKE